MKPKTHTWRAPYGWSYFHWTGLHLSSSHRRIIQSIERQRLAQGSIRIYIADSDPRNSGIPRLLIDYLAWLSTRINPYAQTLLLDRTIRQARNNARLIPRTHALSSFNPSHTRGHFAHQLLLLNADLYGHDWSADITGHLRRHLFPSIPDAPGSVIIIHGNIDPTCNPQFAGEYIRAHRGHFGPHWLTFHPKLQPILKIESPWRSSLPVYGGVAPGLWRGSLPAAPFRKTRVKCTPYPIHVPLHLAAAAAA